MTIIELKYQLEQQIASRMNELTKLGEEYKEVQRKMTDIALELEPVEQLIKLQYPDIAEFLKTLVEFRLQKDAVVTEIKNKGKK